MLSVKYDVYGIFNHHKAFVSIEPYDNIEDTLSMFSQRSISAEFRTSDYIATNQYRWGGIIFDCVRVAKFLASYEKHYPELSKKIEIKVEHKLFWNIDKFEIEFKRAHGNWGEVKGIVIRTGYDVSSNYVHFDCIEKLRKLVVKMAEEIGTDKALEHCRDISRIADAKNKSHLHELTQAYDNQIKQTK